MRRTLKSSDDLVQRSHVSVGLCRLLDTRQRTRMGGHAEKDMPVGVRERGGGGGREREMATDGLRLIQVDVEVGGGGGGGG